MIKLSKENIKIILKKSAEFIFNPRLVFCFFIAWMITNGWAYIAMGLGTYYKINWLVAVSGAYLSFLWFPFTPEKIVTIIIAIWLLKAVFPNDKKTLAVLVKLKQKCKEKKEKK
ncbi:MAG: hypothetical protein MJ090_00735 [Clostridia bacterium]|nr:hypothetical protein [Clostridia bacterium]